jgi:hypothetical protein
MSTAKSRLVVSKEVLRDLRVRSQVRTGIAIDPLPPTFAPPCVHSDPRPTVVKVATHCLP